MPWHSSLSERGHANSLPTVMLFSAGEHPYVPPTHVCHSAEIFNIPHFPLLCGKLEWIQHPSNTSTTKAATRPLMIFHWKQIVINLKPRGECPTVRCIWRCQIWISAIWCWHCAVELLFPSFKDVVTLNGGSGAGKPGQHPTGVLCSLGEWETVCVCVCQCGYGWYSRCLWHYWKQVENVF